MGCDTRHWEDLGRILQKGGPQADGGKFWRGRDGVWVYPPLEDAMAEAVL